MCVPKLVIEQLFHQGGGRPNSVLMCTLEDIAEGREFPISYNVLLFHFISLATYQLVHL